MQDEGSIAFVQRAAQRFDKTTASHTITLDNDKLIIHHAHIILSMIETTMHVITTNKYTSYPNRYKSPTGHEKRN